MSRLLPLAWLLACGPGPVDTGEPPDCESPGRICTVAGTGDFGFNGDGLPALESFFYLPSAVAFDPSGLAIVVDHNNHRVRRLEPDGTTVSLAGSGIHGFAQPGPAITSPMENPVDAQVDAAGTIYVAELHAGRILSISSAGEMAIVAGTGEIFSTGDGGPALDADLTEVDGIALDGDQLYIADTLAHRIRVVDLTTGTIDAVAGTGEAGVVDGPFDAARFDLPDGLAVAPGGLYVTDLGGHTVRFLDLAAGEVRTIAGTGVSGYSGDGGPATDAQLHEPKAVTVDPDGRVYIADSQNHVVRRVNLDGSIETVVGTGAAGEGANAGDGRSVSLADPKGLTWGPDGRLWIADFLNSRVRAWVPLD